MPSPPKHQRHTFDEKGIDIEIPSGAHGNISVSCPRCVGERKNKRAKPLYVDVDQGTWVCMHCSRTGSLTRGWVDAPVAGDGESQPRAREWAAPRALPLTPAQEDLSALLMYAHKRGIGEEALNRNRVVVKTMYCPVCEEEVRHFGFPYFRRKQHVNTKWRCGAKHFRMEKGAERILYGYDDVVLANGQIPQQVIIVEGEFDKLALEQAGYLNVVSVPDGAPAVNTRNYENKFSFLDDDALQRLLQGGCKRVVLAVDADDPGEKLREELIRRCLPEFCYTVTWPEGIKDANDALREMGVEGLRATIEAAEPTPVEGVIEPEMLSAEIDRYYRDGLPRGVSFGWPKLDPYITLVPGAFYVLQAIPQSGKSAFTTAFLLNVAANSDCNFAVCSPEWQPVSVHAIAMLEIITGKPFEGEGRMTPEERVKAEVWLQNYCSFIMPERKSVDVILDRARTIAFRRGLRVLVIDPWTELEHEYDQRAQDKLSYIGRSLSKLRDFGQKHKIAIILCVHPTKPQRSKMEDGRVKYEPLGMYGAAHSADFTNKADFIIELEREGPDDPEVHIHIEKVRMKWAGKPGSVSLYFDRRTGRYSEERVFVDMPAETMR